ncbi:MAG: AAA family ATPase, partial [Clostridia bacterium]
AIYEYIVNLVSITRKTKYFSLGASPRASISLARLAKAFALISGRDYVLPSDISFLFESALSHRVILSQEARAAGVSASDILLKAKETINPPYFSKSGK